MGWVGIPGEANQFGQWVHFGDLHHGFSVPIMVGSVILALAGFGLGWAIFRHGKTSVDLKGGAFGWVYRLLENKYYLDEIYMRGIVRPIREQLARATYWTNQRVIDQVVNVTAFVTVKVGNAAYHGIDQPLIDGTVNGVGRAAGLVGSKLKFWQSGYMQRYAAVLFVSVALLAGVFLMVRF